MSLRTKLVLALVLLAAVATVAIGVSTYVDTADQLRSQVDRSLDAAANDVIAEAVRTNRDIDRYYSLDGSGRPRSFEQIVVQTVDANGSPNVVVTSGDIPLSSAERNVAESPVAGATARRNVTLADGERYRVLTVSLGGGSGAFQVARSLKESDQSLAAIRDRTLTAVAAVIAVAVGLGLLIGRKVTKRLVRLTGVAEEVAATGRLDVSVPVGGLDEAGRLGSAFNEMLEALARSKDAQQRLVQDAGHELRTPLTSLRTNVSVLRQFDRLSPDARARLIDDVDGEARELTTLVNELVELATDRHSDEIDQEVPLASMVERVVERVRRRTGRAIVCELDGTMVVGKSQSLERAVLNLVDNAAKFSVASNEPIEVRLANGRFEVLDRGPGIAESDLSYVFDRFFRSVEARSRPGSGLGLAIVRDVIEAHGGTVFARRRDGGGAIVGFDLAAHREGRGVNEWEEQC